MEDIHSVESIDKNKCNGLYNHLLQQMKVKYLNNHFIDDKINNYVVLTLNDIVYYYLYGNKAIPGDI